MCHSKVLRNAFRVYSQASHKQPNARMGRWRLNFQQFRFINLPSKQNDFSDFMRSIRLAFKSHIYNSSHMMDRGGSFFPALAMNF